MLIEMEVLFLLGMGGVVQLQDARITDVTQAYRQFQLVTNAVDSRAELMLAEMAIHVLVQVEEGVAQPLSVALAEPPLLGLFRISFYPELHQLIPHAAHHDVPDLHPASHQTLNPDLHPASHQTLNPDLHPASHQTLNPDLHPASHTPVISNHDGRSSCMNQHSWVPLPCMPNWHTLQRSPAEDDKNALTTG